MNKNSAKYPNDVTDLDSEFPTARRTWFIWLGRNVKLLLLRNIIKDKPTSMNPPTSFVLFYCAFVFILSFYVCIYFIN